MTLDDLVKFGPLVQAAAMAVTAYFASRGLNAWHQQLAGKRRFELGEDILVLTYKLQRDLAHVRMPVSFGEGKSRPRDDGDTESTAGLKDTYFVPLERIKALDSDLAKFSTIRLQARAHLGRDAVAPFDAIMRAYHTVALSARMLISTVGEKPRDVGLDREWQTAIWQRGESDRIASDVDAAVSRIEELVRPWIEESATLDGGVWQRFRRYLQ